MAIAAVAHIYVYPATPYRRPSKYNLNQIDSIAGEVEEDIEIAATSVKESLKDVVMGGGEHVSIIFSLTLKGQEVHFGPPGVIWRVQNYFLICLVKSVKADSV